MWRGMTWRMFREAYIRDEFVRTVTHVLVVGLLMEAMEWLGWLYGLGSVYAWGPALFEMLKLEVQRW